MAATGCSKFLIAIATNTGSAVSLRITYDTSVLCPKVSQEKLLMSIFGMPLANLGVKAAATSQVAVRLIAKPREIFYTNADCFHICRLHRWRSVIRLRTLNFFAEMTFASVYSALMADLLFGYGLHMRLM